MSADLELKLLGDFAVTAAGAPVPGLNAPRLQELITYLVVHHGVPQPRARIAFLFWPDTSDSQAQTNLRQLLHAVRQRLPAAEAHIDFGDRTIHWRAESPAVVDLLRFKAEVARAAQVTPAERLTSLRAAVDAYGGELLPGSYSEWLLTERERLAQQYAALLEQLVDLCEERRAYAEAIACAQRLLTHDPLHERTYRVMMRLHAFTGDRAAALRVYHTCASMLMRELGVEPSPATRELYERLVSAAGAVVAPAPREASINLVGRQPEWQALQGAWRAAARGGVRCVVLCGEAGIGKTRLGEEMVSWARQQGVLAVTLHAYAASRDLAYTALVDALRSPALAPLVRRLDPVWRTELARLLPELLVEFSQLAPPEPLLERWQRQRLFEAIARVFVGDDRPVVVLVDDLQWHAGETLEWLAFLIRFRPQARVLVIAALRSDEVDTDHPAAAWLLDLRSAGLVTELTLAPLSPGETHDLVRQVARQAFDEETAQSLYRFTEGNPLFVIETLRSAPDLAAVGMAGTAGPAPHALSPRMEAVIQSRLSHLSPPARELAALAATIGRSFSYAVLAQACEQGEELLVRSLDELWQRRIVREQESNGYDFTHDRLRDVAYAAISPAQRKLLHRRVAGALVQVSADTDAVSAQIAGHLHAGGDLRGAIGYYQRAVDVALRLFAYQEAIALIDRALTLVQALPASAVTLESELELQMKLCTAWSAITSYLGKEAERAYTRALDLCRQLPQTPHLFTVLWGLHEIALYRSDYDASVELAEQCLAIAEETGDVGLRLEAHHAAWGPYYFIGEFEKAMAHMRAGLALYDRQAHEALSVEYGVHDACACALYESALASWSMGLLDQAQAWLARAVAHAQTLTMPANIADAQAYAGLLYHLLRDPQHTQAAAERALAISMEKGYPYTRFLGAVALGWSLAMQGNTAEGVALAQQGMAASIEFGQRLHHSQLAAMLAEAYILAGHPVEALDVVEEAIAAFRDYRDHLCAPDLWLLKGEALDRLGAPGDEIEACYGAGLALARQLGARVSELRAATRLARFQQRHGHATAGRKIIQPVVAWFSEGRDSVDLHTAYSLLKELA